MTKSANRSRSKTHDLPACFVFPFDLKVFIILYTTSGEALSLKIPPAIEFFLCYRTQRAVVKVELSEWALALFFWCPTRDRSGPIVVFSVH